MLGRMQRHALQIKDFMTFAAREHGEREVVTLAADGVHRTNYSRAEAQSRRLSSALARLGIVIGDRIATLAVNSEQHFLLSYAISCLGAVCHTINPRLFSPQVAYIIRHAADRMIFVDSALIPVLEAVVDDIKLVVTHIAIIGSAPPDVLAQLRRHFHVMDYDDLLESGDANYEWPDLDEDIAASLCYTSGTTGDPKGVLYSHRSTVLHAYGANLKDAFSFGANDVVFPLVPMFHTNCWGFPYMAPMVGAKLVFSALSLMDGKSITELMQSEGVTFACGVPTVWASLLRYLDDTGERIPSVERLQVGGAACPFPIIERYWREHKIKLIHGWGMTELSPIGVINREKPHMQSMPVDDRLANQRKQGRGIFGIEMKIIDPDGRAIERDGATSGRLMVRGHWVVDTYFGSEQSALEGGWFDTGDIAHIDEHGYMEIVDRSKDIIKSGGEWISSIALERIAMSIPGIYEAAAIPVKHDRWDERPLLLAVRSKGSTVERADVLRAFEGTVAKWWLPDDVLFVDELPHNATGKVVKSELRRTYENYLLEK
jgi:fatty-acyl-CoA synthase